MPAERVPMRHAREIIRLKFSASLPTREIARRLGLAPSTVRETLTRVESAGLSWPLPEGIGDAGLEAALYANRRSKRGHRRHAEPNWLAVHRELKRKHVTLLIVWDEYIATNPGGYSYSRFCELYRGFEAKLSPTMRQTHVAGERLFVDYAGDGVPVVVDRLTGEIRMAQIFVAVLGASSFTFAHASWTQTLPDWIDAHVRALSAIGGVPHLLVPDNTKTGLARHLWRAFSILRCPPFELKRADEVERRMAAEGIVEAVDVTADCDRGFDPALEHGAPDQFGLEGLEERLDHGVVEAVSLARHRDRDAVLSQLSLVLDGAVLAATDALLFVKRQFVWR